MKSTGVVRKVDELGRIVIPIEIRRIQNISVKDPLEIFVEGDSIVLKKYETSCVFCSSQDEIKEFENKNVCGVCLQKLNKL
ncbi:transcriptional pleiotropic regulator of transition state genes [Acetoanaerobium pronyense]|uniref:Transcriptional pleiotropic regulator of transition state genes n=1 Tax=Acetoanaerobium pronyense TaxID=1482736 RepID=A0ABS4KJU4_9FIRM|nr:AbrB/MazE/SpoVT family DNA-binding domain-containing protein [Acetoanaerobium pronyense]MBP2028063.1 transcriptional pleiotropic regulator of transition state genes [Acetoanaerobium pronyense]